MKIGGQRSLFRAWGSQNFFKMTTPIFRQFQLKFEFSQIYQQLISHICKTELDCASFAPIFIEVAQFKGDPLLFSEVSNEIAVFTALPS